MLVRPLRDLAVCKVACHPLCSIDKPGVSHLAGRPSDQSRPLEGNCSITGFDQTVVTGLNLSSGGTKAICEDY